MILGTGETALDAAFVLRDAAASLSADFAQATDRHRYQQVADRLEAVGYESAPDRCRILEASPFVIERSGEVRTLVEMIEHEPAEAECRSRLAKLLLRALIWHPAGPVVERDAS